MSEAHVAVGSSRSPVGRTTFSIPVVHVLPAAIFAAASAKAQANGSVVQLVRMPACHAGGRWFESRPDREKAPGMGLFSFPGMFIRT